MIHQFEEIVKIRTICFSYSWKPEKPMGDFSSGLLVFSRVSVIIFIVNLKKFLTWISNGCGITLSGNPEHSFMPTA